MSKPGKLVPPYPQPNCASTSCEKPLSDEVEAYMYKDLATDKLVIFCDDCARHVELNHGDRFVLVPL